MQDVIIIERQRNFLDMINSDDNTILEDELLHLTYSDGQEICLMGGEEIPRIRRTGLVSGIYSTESDLVVFGNVNIFYDEQAECYNYN